MSDLKVGYYGATIESWSLGQSKEKGTPEFAITFILDHYKGPGGSKVECPNLKRTAFRYITDKTIDYFVNDLKALGYDRDDFDGLDPKSSTAFDFEGIEIEVQLNYETYEGKQKEKWNLALNAGKITSKPLPEDGVSALNALFGNRLKALKGNAPAPARKPAESAAAGSAASGEEEIPF